MVIENYKVERLLRIEEWNFSIEKIKLLPIVLFVIID